MRLMVVPKKLQDCRHTLHVRRACHLLAEVQEVHDTATSEGHQIWRRLRILFILFSSSEMKEVRTPPYFSDSLVYSAQASAVFLPDCTVKSAT